MFSPSSPNSFLHSEPSGEVRARMGQSSPSSSDFLPSLCSPGSKSDKPPTYTTVGSVFNPDATPIRPPARRGRTKRYQFYHSPPGGLVAGFLHNVPLSSRDPVLGAPLGPRRMLHYSPLQQNYDRAVTPVHETDKNTPRGSAAMATPGMRSGNMPRPRLGPMSPSSKTSSNRLSRSSSKSSNKSPSKPSIKSRSKSRSKPSRKSRSKSPRKSPSKPSRKSRSNSLSRSPSKLPRKPSIKSPSKTDSTVSSFSDAYCTTPNNNLASCFNVKSLTSLASYPNPMQQIARKALARARQFNTSVFRAEPTLSTPQTSSSLPRERLDRGLFGTSGLFTGAGAPQPLTAGPPGLRQHRPSVFDTVGRHTRNMSTSPNVPPHTRLHNTGFSPVSARRLQSDLEDLPFCPNEASFNREHLASQPQPTLREDLGLSGVSSIDLLGGVRVFPGEEQAVDSPSDSSYAGPPVGSQESSLKSYHVRLIDARRNIFETEDLETIQKYYPRGLPNNYKGLDRRLPRGWLDHYPLHPRTAQPMLKAQSEREAHINQKFYAGIQKLSISGAENLENAGSCMGTSTDDRFSARVGKISWIGRNGDVHYQHLSIKDASSMDTTLHAEPLLNMLFTTLHCHVGQHRQSGGVGRFVKADPSLVDNTEGANRSVFSETTGITKRNEPSSTGSYRSARRRTRRYMRPRRL